MTEDLLAPLCDLVADYDSDGAWLVAEAEAFCSEADDPARLVNDLVGYLRRSSRLATDLRALRSDPLMLQHLVDLAQHSRIGYDLACRSPLLFWDQVQRRTYRNIYGRQFMAERLADEMKGVTDYDHRINALVRFRDRQQLRLMLGDVAGDVGFEAVVGELSDLTDVLVQAALALAIERYRPRYGVASCHLVVLGMGKLGGSELNYSSDIDLILVYHERGQTSGGREDIGHHDYFCRVGTELIRILDGFHSAGRLFRVDMRLRPEGAAGELALTLAETINYYYSVGRAWERQAMIKARPIAGDVALGEELLAELRPWIYPRDHRLDDLDDTRLMRQRIEERAAAANVKTGAGGIRDIEFLVQFYQLTYGGAYPRLRGRATLPMIRELHRIGLLSRADAAALEADYIWLRMVEHRLQMYQGRQVHELPAADDERRHVALRSGFRGSAALPEFDAHHAQVRERVRAISAHHYLETNAEEDAAFALLGSEEMSLEVAQTVLGSHGFADIATAAKRLRALSHEPFFILQRSRTQRALVRLLPALVTHLGRAPVPDEALANFQRIVDAVGGRASFYELLIDEPRVLILMCRLAGWSTFVVNELARRSAG
ncbi:MAG: [protein-PII] uridylyltransferase family protein [Planctomycetota bacterium]|jgi:glutamate-ammonia-ligase adenylyltransferase